MVVWLDHMDSRAAEGSFQRINQNLLSPTTKKFRDTNVGPLCNLLLDDARDFPHPEVGLSLLGSWHFDDFVTSTALVEVTRTDPLEKLVWTNKKDPDNERNKILNRTKDPHPA